jgi:hypothetical protein
MWLCLNDSFLSIVDKDCNHDCLLVRARRKGDIERVFGKVAVPLVAFTPKADYAYRAVLHRDLVKAAMIREVDRICYPNFKNTVQDEDLHSAYLSIWSVMYRVQASLLARLPKRRRRR